MKVQAIAARKIFYLTELAIIYPVRVTLSIVTSVALIFTKELRNVLLKRLK